MCSFHDAALLKASMSLAQKELAFVSRFAQHFHLCLRLGWEPLHFPLFFEGVAPSTLHSY